MGLSSLPRSIRPFSGALKTLLDLLPERALEGKIVLPLATGGTIAHMLAVDYALKPVLNALKAQEILHGVFADDSRSPTINISRSLRLICRDASTWRWRPSGRRCTARPAALPRSRPSAGWNMPNLFRTLALSGLLTLSALSHAAQSAPDARASATKRQRQYGAG